MTRALVIGLLAGLLARAAMAQEAGSPHAMTKPDGSLDMETCGVCHTPDMGLNLPKSDTCTLCHLETTHGGSLAHLRARPERVKAGMASAPEGSPVLPLREDGGMFCGTCHTFHDPNVLGEKPLAKGWVPPDQGLAAAVRQGATRRWDQLAEVTDHKGPLAEFATQGSRRLWLPVENGALCLACHGELR